MPPLPEEGSLVRERLPAAAALLVKGWYISVVHNNPATHRQSNFTAGFFNQAVFTNGNICCRAIKCSLMFAAFWAAAMYLDKYIFSYRLPVKHTYYTMAVTCIMFAVRYHYYGGALLIQFGKQLHNLVTVG